MKRVIEGSKEDFLGLLQGRRDKAGATAGRRELPQTTRSRHQGMKQGLDFAMAAVRDWQLPEAPKPAGSFDEWLEREFPDGMGSGSGGVYTQDDMEEAYQARQPRTWLYGLTADEWFRLACLGPDSEVAPCCGNLGELRDLLRELMIFQAEGDAGWLLPLGEQILLVYEGDGNKDGDADAGHGLIIREKFPLLNRVLDGIRAQQAQSQELSGAGSTQPGQSSP